MDDRYGIDSHKLIYHPQRVAKWLTGENIFPLTVEISPSGACNHRCCFCAFDYLEYQPAFLEKNNLMMNLELMAAGGVKSVVVAGEGEPLLHPEIERIVAKITGLGMDAAMASNGVLFTEEKAQSLLPHLTWIRFSVNAGSTTTHQKIHQGKSGDFETIMANLAIAVRVKREKALPVTLGVQLLMIPDNSGEVRGMAARLREIGVDYFTVKPYSQHPKSLNRAAEGAFYTGLAQLEADLAALNTNKFQVIFRARSMGKLQQERCYRSCHGIPFWAYIDARGNLWPCLAYVGDEAFLLGNINGQSFAEIWNGSQRTSVMERIAMMDVSNCRQLCRLDEINAYLEKLKYPGGHVNFI